VIVGIAALKNLIQSLRFIQPGVANKAPGAKSAAGDQVRFLVLELTKELLAHLGG
jgi:hypothetical protein